MDAIGKLAGLGTVIVPPTDLLQPTTPWLLYLLHNDDPEARQRHYLGITQRDHLIHRLRRHAYGTGSLTVRNWPHAPAGVRVAILICAAGFEHERRLKVASHYNRWCPVCRGDTTGSDLAKACDFTPQALVRWRPADLG